MKITSRNIIDAIIDKNTNYLDQLPKSTEVVPDGMDEVAYFIGLHHMVAGDDALGMAFIQFALKRSRLSADFFSLLHRLVSGLGAEGAALRAKLQHHRVLPAQVIGHSSVGGAEKQDQTQPWGYLPGRVYPFPRKNEEFNDLGKVIVKYVTKGWTPPAPLFKPDDVLLTVGSCFAQELRNVLRERGLNAEWLFMPPDLHNTFAMRDFFRWCVTGDVSGQDYWRDLDPDGGSAVWTPAGEQSRYREVLSKISGLVLTIGLAEVWGDVVSGKVFWRGVPKDMFDPQRHKERLSSVDENKSNIDEIIALFRQVNPSAPVIITLSPVPLRATSRGVSCITADCVSKSILRVAIDLVMQAAQPVDNIYYWPSFEIVRWLSAHVESTFFGEDGNPRHVNYNVVAAIIETFIGFYFISPTSLR